jgi:hypothetical protein
VSACGQCGARISEPARCLNGHAISDGPPPVQIDKLAELVAERLAPLLADRLGLRSPSDDSPNHPVPQNGAVPAVLVDVHEIARITGMSERWAYEHAAEIGGVKAGKSKRARWRFDPDRALALLAARNGQPVTAVASNSERRELPGDAPLLPVKGRAA